MREKGCGGVGGDGGGDGVRGQESRISMLDKSSSSGKERETSSEKEKGINSPRLPLLSARCCRLLRGALGGLVRLYGVLVMLRCCVAFSASSWLYSIVPHACHWRSPLIGRWGKLLSLAIGKESGYSTSPRSGNTTRRRFDMGIGESTCPWGNDSFSFTQHLLSSKADSARLLKDVVCIVCCFERRIVICTCVVFCSSNASLNMSCFILRTRCFEMPLARLMAVSVSLYFMLYIFGRRRIISSSVWPAVSSLKHPNLALFTVLYMG